jgi:uncharacterized protein (DUF4213/DUF364 family)
MVSTEVISSLKEALTELRIAEFELNRPHEDVVAMSVCYSARLSLNSLLRTYLLSNNQDPNLGKSSRELLEKCISIDGKFSAIPISALQCNSINHEACDGKYCMSVDKVSECLNAANQAKEIVLETLKIKESELN